MLLIGIIKDLGKAFTAVVLFFAIGLGIGNDANSWITAVCFLVKRTEGKKLLSH